MGRLSVDSKRRRTAVVENRWIHFLVMGLGMYCWGWSMGMGTAGRLFMAVAGLFNFKLIVAGYAGWMTVIPALTICPLVAGRGDSQR
jgi:hypothetical protein